MSFNFPIGSWQTVAHTTTALLSWYVQQFVMMYWFNCSTPKCAFNPNPARFITTVPEPRVCIANCWRWPAHVGILITANPMTTTINLCVSTEGCKPHYSYSENSPCWKILRSGPCFNMKNIFFLGIWISILQIRLSWDHLILMREFLNW